MCGDPQIGGATLRTGDHLGDGVEGPNRQPPLGESDGEHAGARTNFEDGRLERQTQTVDPGKRGRLAALDADAEDVGAAVDVAPERRVRFEVLLDQRAGGPWT